MPASCTVHITTLPGDKLNLEACCLGLIEPLRRASSQAFEPLAIPHLPAYFFKAQVDHSEDKLEEFWGAAATANVQEVLASKPGPDAELIWA